MSGFIPLQREPRPQDQTPRGHATSTVASHGPSFSFESRETASPRRPVARCALGNESANARQPPAATSRSVPCKRCIKSKPGSQSQSQVALFARIHDVYIGYCKYSIYASVRFQTPIYATVKKLEKYFRGPGFRVNFWLSSLDDTLLRRGINIDRCGQVTAGGEGWCIVRWPNG